MILSNCRYTCHTPPESQARNGTTEESPLTTVYPDENENDADDEEGEEYDSISGDDADEAAADFTEVGMPFSIETMWLLLNHFVISYSRYRTAPK